MPVGLSDGSYHEDYTTMVAMSIPKDLKRIPVVKDPEVSPGVNPGDYGMVVDPFVMQQNRKLDQIELDPEAGIGLEVGFKRPLGASEKPAGEFNSSGGGEIPGNTEKAEIDWSKLNQPTGEVRMLDVGDSPLSRQIEDFKTQAAKPVKPLKDATPEEIQTAIDVAMSFGTGTMAGVKAKTMKGKLSDLGLAQILEQAGEHPDVIWKRTGFARGAEGRWRHEIDDSKAIFDKSWSKAIDEGVDGIEYTVLSRPLPKILDHPELYKAYPELAKVRVSVDKNYEASGAVFNEFGITMGPKAAKEKGILMHEIQHWIQQYEGFAKGGSPAKATGNFNIDNAAWMNYRRLAGEVEANNVDARLLLTEGERRGRAPWWTEDVVRRDQIVRSTPAEATHEGVYDPILKRMEK